MLKFYQQPTFLNGFIKLINDCNKKILEIYEQDFEIIYKNDNSPLTNADLESNKLICEYLTLLNKNLKEEIGEDFCIISEENKNMNYNFRKEFKYTWLVDPIDGTKEFLKKNGQFTVNIGLCRDGVPIFGIVSIPTSNEIYYGIENLGSFKIENTGEIKKLKINKKDFTQKNMNIIASLSHMNDDTKKYIEQFTTPNLMNIGSSMKLLYIAENKADVYPRYALTSEWDTCAAHAVVKYAGGKVFIAETRQELIYNKENILNPYFLVY